MSSPDPSALDADLRVRLSEPMLGRSLRPVSAKPWHTEAMSPSEVREAHEAAAGREAVGSTHVMNGHEQRIAGEREATTAGVAVPRRMSGAQEWVLLPLPDAPEGVIGRGGQGVVYSYVQRELGREVAVKRLRADRWSYGAIEDLVREACVTARLEHPNIVPVHYLHLPEHDGDAPYWVMKRIRGHELTEHLPGGTDPWPFDRLLDVFRRILDANIPTGGPKFPSRRVSRRTGRVPQDRGTEHGRTEPAGKRALERSCQSHAHTLLSSRLRSRRARCECLGFHRSYVCRRSPVGRDRAEG